LPGLAGIPGSESTSALARRSSSTLPSSGGLTSDQFDQMIPHGIRSKLHQSTNGLDTGVITNSITTTPGVVTESIKKTTFTETTVQRVTNTKLIEEVRLARGGGPLGLSIIGGSDHSCVPFGTGEQGIYISKIIPGGAASATGRLRMGDRVLKVNSVDVKSCSHQEAVLALLQPCDVMSLQIQHDPLPPGFMEVDIVKASDEKLGMVVKGGIKGQPGNPLDAADEGVFCVRIIPGGAAAKDPRIQVGLRLIEVNGQSLLGATHQEAVNILRNAGDVIKLWVCHGFDPANLSTSQDGETDELTKPQLTNGNSSPQFVPEETLVHSSKEQSPPLNQELEPPFQQEESISLEDSAPITARFVPSVPPPSEPASVAPLSESFVPTLPSEQTFPKALENEQTFTQTKVSEQTFAPTLASEKTYVPFVPSTIAPFVPDSVPFVPSTVPFVPDSVPELVQHPAAVARTSRIPLPVSSTSEVSRPQPSFHTESNIPREESSAAQHEAEHSFQPVLTETTPRKKSLLARPPIATKPQSPMSKMRASSEPPSDSATAGAMAAETPVLSGGEPASLPPLLAAQGSSDSPMPELLSLRDRLKLFEKEIEQQSVPEPKKDRKFSFLSEDELMKMKAEEAVRIASLTKLDLDTLDSLTSQLSQEDTDILLEQVEAISRVGPEEIILPGQELSDSQKKEARSVWRKERLRSLEEDTEEAQQIAERITELSRYSEEDNASFTLPTDTMGNIDSHHHEAANHGTEELIQVSETTNHETETLLHVTESSNNGTELSHHITTNQIRGSDFHVTEITKMASESADVDTDTETDMMTSEDQHSGPDSPLT